MTSVAIIVPFRLDIPIKIRKEDVNALNSQGRRILSRKEQLERFVPYMVEYLSQTTFRFKIFIVEQINFDKKFNRGKLLNIGFKEAVKENFDAYIFHDVDLIPSKGLLKYYMKFPINPIHIGHVWQRYTGKNYIGGVLSISSYDFERIDGFPNIYYGWGSEDDELYRRLKDYNIPIEQPKKTKKDYMIDLESLNLEQKLDILRNNQDLKCTDRKEINKVHDYFRKQNKEHNKGFPKWWGLKHLKYKIENKIDNDIVVHFMTAV